MTIAFASVMLGALTAGVAAQEPAVEEQIIDAFQALFGKHPGQRANHAKGIVVEGSFTATPEAASLSRAAHLQGEAVPVTVRFSNATGIPDLADGDPKANPHGMAVKFRLPDGSDTDIVSNSLRLFPVATPTEFRDLLAGRGRQPTGQPRSPPSSTGSWPATRPSRAPGPPPKPPPATPPSSISASTRSNSSTRRASGNSSATAWTRWSGSPTSSRPRRPSGHRITSATDLQERLPARPPPVPPPGAGRGPGGSDHGRHHPLAREPPARRARAPHPHHPGAGQRGRIEGAPVPPRPADRRHRAFGRPPDRRPRRRLRHLLRAAERVAGGRCRCRQRADQAPPT